MSRPWLDAAAIAATRGRWVPSADSASASASASASRGTTTAAATSDSSGVTFFTVCRSPFAAPFAGYTRIAVELATPTKAVYAFSCWSPPSVASD